jgi:Arc/MetJ-type ribon-helix-helix transcriptional regulator
MTTQVAIRLPAEMVSRLDELVPRLHPSRSDAVRRSIELYIYRLACEADAARYADIPLTDDELSLADDPASWSETPAW